MKLAPICFFISTLPFLEAKPDKRPSVVLIVVDDMRSPSGLGLHLPNYEKLARIGISFENAFAQQALCAPSRNSFLTGRRPDTLHLYDFYNYWRDSVGNFTTLPQFFKENGYRTYSFGKVFHPGESSNFTDDSPYSWSEPPYHPSTERYKESKTCIDSDNGHMARNLVCPVEVQFQPEQTLPDIQIAEAAIEKLKVLNINNEKPYFMGIGFHKPHIPLKFPISYLDLYPLSKINPAKMPFRPPSMPTVAWNPWLDVKDRDDISKLNLTFPYGEMPKIWSLKVIQSYFAAISYIDDLIGNLLDNIDLNNTIVVLTSDHGWSLGEHGEWAKYSNFDVALKVPLIIYAPKYNQKSVKIKDIVELIDLFPTLAEISGLIEEFPKCNHVKMNLCTDGNSLVPLIKMYVENHSISWNKVAYSQYPRPGINPSRKPNSDKPRLKDIEIMGYTVRTDRYRYTEWLKFNHSSFSPNWGMIEAKELYDHFIDDGENLNLSDRFQLEDLMEELSLLLKSDNDFYEV